MSVRLSTVLPRACSGLMYAAVPRIIPSARVAHRHGRRFVRSGVEPPPPTAFARPKSSTFTVPSGVILMFAGFRSRWTMPLVVGGVERIGDLPRDRQRLCNRQPAVRCAALFQA